MILLQFNYRYDVAWGLQFSMDEYVFARSDVLDELSGVSQ